MGTNFLWRRLRAFVFPLLIVTLLSACWNNEIAWSILPFSSQDNEATVDVDFGRLAGNISAQDFASLITSPNVVIEAKYLPTKLIWLINANYVTHWEGGIIILPRWELTPRAETIRVKPKDYQIIDGRHLRFKVKRKISTYYELAQAKINIPAPPKPMSNWPNELFSLSIHLSTSGQEKPEQVGFVFESIQYALAGSVSASNAYVSAMDNIDKVTTETTSPDARAALQGSRFSGYQKVLQDRLLQDEYPTRLIFDARSIQKNKSTPHDNNGDACPECCCQPSIEQQTETMENYNAWLRRYRNNRNWTPVAIVDSKLSDNWQGMKVFQNEHILAKAEGHLLDNFSFETGLGKSDQMSQCIGYNKFELFFVDRKLVDYRLEATTCSGNGAGNKSVTHAKWDDRGQPVFFSLICKSCKETNEQTTTDQRAWATMESLGAYISQNVLRLPDIYEDVEHGQLK